MVSFAIGGALFAVLLGGCVPARRHPLAIPDARAPHFARIGVSLKTAGLRAGAWPATHWWRIFHDPELSRLIHIALKHNEGLKAAEGHLQAATDAADFAASRTGLSLSLRSRALRERASASGLIPPPFAGHTFDYGSVGLRARYDLAFWDHQHIAIAAALGAQKAARADAAEVRLLVSTEVAERYWHLAAAASGLREARALLRLRKSIETLLEARFQAGVAGAVREDEALASLASLRTRVHAERLALLKARFALAATLGRGPQFGLNLALPTRYALPKLSFPHRIGLDLIARRPDIQVRYWQVREALARRDAARARYYPDISLGANLGYQSITLSDLIDPANLAATVGPALNLPLFGDGARQARLRSSRAQFDIAVAHYNSAIVKAARDVAVALQTLAALQKEQQDAKVQTQQATRAFTLMQRRFRAGVIGAVPEQEAKLSVIEARYTETRAHVGVLEAEIAVLKNLGGGYRARPAPRRPTLS